MAPPRTPVPPPSSLPAARAGLQSESLIAALSDALAGRSAELERLLARMGAVLTDKPNLRLAAAFGIEVAARPGRVEPVLARLAAEDAAPDTERAFLPIAAAHGYAALVQAGREVDRAWAALERLAADERVPVRVGVRDALLSLALRTGGADDLIARGLAWISDEDQDDANLRFGAAAMVIDVLSDRRLLTAIRDHEALLDYLSRALAAVADAPRSSERLDSRRWLLQALPRTLAGVAAQGSNARRGQEWLAAESAQAIHIDVRRVLSDALVGLRGPAHGLNAAVVDDLRRSLEQSAKPLRDPTRRRPGTGRGKDSRRTR